MRRLLRSAAAFLAATGNPARIACGACATAAALALAWPVDTGMPAGPRRRPLDLAALAALDDGGAARSPLFDPARRAWTAGGTREDVLGLDRPSLSLTLRGVLIEPRGRRALLDDGSPNPDWLSEGQGRGPWRVTRIEPGRVVVDDGQQRYTVDVLAAPVRLRPPPRLQTRRAPDGP